MSSMNTSIVMTLKDRITGPVGRIQSSLRGISERSGLNRLRSVASRAGESLGRVVERVKRLGAGLGVLGLGAAGAVWGVERVVSSVADAAAEIKRTSERLDVGTTWLQEWMYVAKQFGVQNDALVDGFKELAMRADEFVKTGSGPAAEAYKRLGITVEDLRKTGGRTEDILKLVMQQIRKVDNAAKRQRIFDEIFGGQGGEQLIEALSATREQIEGIKKAAHETGAIMSPEELANAREYRRSMVKLQETITGIKRAVVGGLLPAINDWLERLGLLTKKNRELVASKIIDGIKQVASAIAEVARVANNAVQFVGGWGNALKLVAGVLALRYVRSVVRATKATYKLTKRFVKFSRKVVPKVVSSLGKMQSGLVRLSKRGFSVAGRGLASVARGSVSMARGFGRIAVRAIPAAISAIATLGATLMATPVGWIMGAIALIAGAVYLIYRNWDAISTWFGNLWDSVKRIFSAAVGAVTGVVASLWDGIKGFFSQGIAGIVKDLLAFSPAGLLLKGVNEVFEMFTGHSLVEVGKNWIGGLWDGITDMWGQLTSWLSSAVDRLFGWMPDWVQDKLGLGSLSAPMPSAPPVARSGGATGSWGRAEVGGTLHIKVDSEGRPRVTEIERRGGMDIDVDSGVLGLTP